MVTTMGLTGALQANLAQQEDQHPYTEDHLATIRKIIAEETQCPQASQHEVTTGQPLTLTLLHHMATTIRPLEVVLGLRSFI